MTPPVEPQHFKSKVFFDPNVIEITPPTLYNNPPNSTKQKEAILNPEVINVESDDNSTELILFGQRVRKGKEIQTTHQNMEVCEDVMGKSLWTDKHSSSSDSSNHKDDVEYYDFFSKDHTMTTSQPSLSLEPSGVQYSQTPLSKKKSNDSQQRKQKLKLPLEIGSSTSFESGAPHSGLLPTGGASDWGLLPAGGAPQAVGGTLHLGLLPAGGMLPAAGAPQAAGGTLHWGLLPAGGMPPAGATPDWGLLSTGGTPQVVSGTPHWGLPPAGGISPASGTPDWGLLSAGGTPQAVGGTTYWGLPPAGGAPEWGLPSTVPMMTLYSPYHSNFVGPSYHHPGAESINQMWSTNAHHLQAIPNYNYPHPYSYTYDYNYTAPVVHHYHVPPAPLFHNSLVQNSVGDENNGATTNSTVATISDEAREEILVKFRNFKQFDVVEDVSDHHFVNADSSMQQHSKNWAKRIQGEWKSLEKDLPDSIFVRVYESRIDLLRAVIIAAEGTPYHDGLFFFDVYFPSGYPHVPPNVHYHSGGLRLNPNLYNCGKVCLSLLNTWTGHQNEQWISGVSTILQVLVSIQGLILVAKPFFNEPGYAHLNGSQYGEISSLRYNEDSFILSLRTMMYIMKRPPKNFEDFVVGHFCRRAHDILETCKAYIDGAQVGCVVKGGAQDVDQGDNSSSIQFRTSLAAVVHMLIKEFTQIGAKDCDQVFPSTAAGNPSGEMLTAAGNPSLVMLTEAGNPSGEMLTAAGNLSGVMPAAGGNPSIVMLGNPSVEMPTAAGNLSGIMSAAVENPSVEMPGNLSGVMPTTVGNPSVEMLGNQSGVMMTAAGNPSTVEMPDSAAIP
ncbi:putative ubiquitin-conjugating enzyme E2 25 isoform B [Glycine soja]|uniref:E2 ubiquitin-conjugating enzyme n=1 Tax=Glycine soja TaxID=3848 RepID=A0A445KE52_GLYSO|nr:putative ubiquitin-conjugating enzyme E2 25 isoform B [Glycine soja]